MGCACEIGRESQSNKTRTKQQQTARTNQCGSLATTAIIAATAATATTATTTIIKTVKCCNSKHKQLRGYEDIKIKDNYQQNHKNQRAQATASLKASTRVLLTSSSSSEQQQQQSSEVAPKDEAKHKQQQQQQQQSKVDVKAQALATTTTIDTTASTTPNGLPTICANCCCCQNKKEEANTQINLKTKIRIKPTTKTTTTTTTPARAAKATSCDACCRPHEQRRRQHRDQYVTATLAAAFIDNSIGGSRLKSVHKMLLHARATLATQLSLMRSQAQVSLITQPTTTTEQQQSPSLAYHGSWESIAAAAGSMPATMSAAILSNVSATAAATSAAAYQYLGQHYKYYSQSLSFYAASSVILMLCYLTTTSTAAATNSETGALDKHPIHGIDWSKFDESSSDKEILDLLLEKKRYDKRLLPPVNGTLTVNVNVLLLSLASPDESSLKYEVEFLLNQQWNDPRLQYGNKSHYDFLNALHHHDSIWTPDTYFIMHGDFKDPIIPMHFALRIFRNGTITYAMRRHLILSCQGSLHIFPFDDPKCSFSMESISYEEAQIKYVWKNDEDTLRKSPSLTTLNAYLIKNQTTACDQNSWRGNYSCLRVDLIFTRDRAFYFTTVFIPGIILVTSSFITFWLEWNAVPARSMIGNYSCLQVELTFTRDRAYYFTTVFIPGIILVTSSFITFWLEWNAVPARVMIGVTTMLNFFTTSNGFRSTLPVVSNLTAMNVWDGVCMCFIYASLLEFVCVNYVGRKRPLHNVVYRPGENPVTQRLPAVLSRIGVILASPLGIIDREFHAALSSEKASAGPSPAMATPLSMGTATSTASPGTPRQGDGEGGMRWQEAHGGIIGAAVQNLRARSIKRKGVAAAAACALSTSGRTTMADPVYAEPTELMPTPAATSTRVKFKDEQTDETTLRRSVATSTPALVLRIEREQLQQDMEFPLKPPRKKSSRSNSPASVHVAGDEGAEQLPTVVPTTFTGTGEKRRDAGAANEIVACTTCGGSNSPCTHSANNGCATETCFVQVRKKEPPHPIRVAKTIDVIARITFPTAYAIFLIFFFVHYKGFS